MDFSTQQLTWIIIGACSLGGTGYMTIDTAMQKLDTKMEVTVVKVQDTNDKLAEMKAQLSRIEDTLASRK